MQYVSIDAFCIAGAAFGIFQHDLGFLFFTVPLSMKKSSCLSRKPFLRVAFALDRAAYAPVSSTLRNISWPACLSWLYFSLSFCTRSASSILFGSTGALPSLTLEPRSCTPQWTIIQHLTWNVHECACFTAQNDL